MQRILVFVAHPGDEVIGSGGYLSASRIDGASVRVVVVTTGAMAHLGISVVQNIRDECRSGLEILGINDVCFWNYRSGAVPLSGEILGEYLKELRAFIPDIILLPSPSETVPESRRITRGVIKAIQQNWNGQLLFFETVHPLIINTAKDISSQFELKRLALRANTFITKSFRHEENCESRARLRGLTIGKEYAEGFLTYQWDGSRQNFFDTRPLISVIVRSDDMQFLRHALNSLILQEYDQLEVVLVWYGNGEPDLTEFDYLDITFVKGNRGRGFNLNCGLSHAHGEFIAFLDQDDIVYPGHFSVLLWQLYGNTDYDIAYSGCRVVRCEMRDGTPFVLSEETVMNQGYQPGRFIIGNYIPFHALLFRNTVFRGKPFDEVLTAYEDWEMLAQLELSGFRFLHLEQITCEYRVYDKEKTLVQVHEEKGYFSQREIVLTKILKKLSPRDLMQLADIVGKLDIEVKDIESSLSMKQQQIEELQKMNEDHRSLEMLLERGMAAAGIEDTGRTAVTKLLSRMLEGGALFSIIMPVYNTPADILSETLLSIRNQVYDGWELCLVDDCSDREDTVAILSTLQEDPFFTGRLRFRQRKERGGIVDALNDCIDLSTLPYLVFVDHDDIVHAEALLEMALSLKERKDCRLIYTDHRIVDRAGKLMQVYHKPEWSQDNLLYSNYINHLVAVCRAVFKAAGGFRKAYEGAQDLDLLLRLSDILKEHEVCHIGRALYDWRATEESVAYASSAKPYSADAATRAVADYLTGKGFDDVQVDRSSKGFGFAVNWRAPLREIRIIINAEGDAARLKKCVKSILEETDYPLFSITVIGNASIKSGASDADSFSSLAETGRVCFIGVDGPLNWSASNNLAVQHCAEPVLLFLHEDIEVPDSDWLSNMVKYIMLDGVGAVGAVLQAPDGFLLHNGMETNEDFIASNITTLGGRNIYSASRNVSVVTGACMMTTRNALEHIGWFNEQLPIFFGDVDACLSLRKAGMRIVQASDVRLVHYDISLNDRTNRPEQREERERSSNALRHKWGSELIEKYNADYEIFSSFTKIVNIK